MKKKNNLNVINLRNAKAFFFDIIKERIGRLKYEAKSK